MKGSVITIRLGERQPDNESFDKPSSIRGSGLALSIDMSRERTGSAAGAIEHIPDGPSHMSDALRFSACDYSEPALDDVIVASFPASDPPSWTTGTAMVAAASSLP